MRKNYLLWMAVLLPALQINGQTYCTPVAGAGSQANYLKSATFSDQGALYYNTSTYNAYVDNSNQVVTSYPGGAVAVHLETTTGGTGSYVWVDWNGDGDFDDFYENPLAPSQSAVVDDVFFVPPTQAAGIYRIRVQSGMFLNDPVDPCGPNDFGGFVDFSLQIESTSSCFVPSDVTVTDITNESAAISWTEPTSTPGNGYEYYYSSSDIVPDPTTQPSGSSSVNSVSINSLTASTNYFVYVRSVCSFSDKSEWSLRGTFKTKCDPLTSMFEDFESTSNGAKVANCWDKLGSGSLSIFVGDGVNNSKGVTQSALSPSDAVIAVLPLFSNTSAETNWLRFKAKVGNTPGVLNIGYVTNDADPDSFVNIESVNIANKTYDGYEYTVNVPSTVPANARLAIKHGGVPAVNVYWDNIYWEAKPSCLPVTNLVTSNITSSTVDLAWTESASNPAGYDIYYSRTNTPPTSTTPASMTNVTSNPYTITNLEPGKTYFIWVRARCNDTDQSSWSNVTSIVTNCAPVTELFENFDSYNTGFITKAACWDGLTEGFIVPCDIVQSVPAASGTNHVFQRAYGAGDISIAILPQFSNVNEGTHRLRFKAYCTANTGKLKIGYVTDPTSINSFVLIKELNITNTSYNSNYYTVDIPATVPANARLAVRNDFETSGTAQYYWDDLYWESSTLGINETNLTDSDIAVYPNPFNDIVNISGNSEITSISVYDASGRVTRKIATPSSSVSLKELSSGIYLIQVTFKNGSMKTIKVVKN